MVKPSLFNLTTDYATLGNDAGGTGSATVAGAQVIAGAGHLEYSQDLFIGAQASINRLQISSSKDSNIRYSTQLLSYGRTGSLGTYSIVAFAYRIAPSTLRCSVYIQNPYAGAMTTAAGDETFIFYIDTFIPPFA